MDAMTLALTAGAGLLAIRLFGTTRAANSLQVSLADASLVWQGIMPQVRIKLAVLNPTRTAINITGITGTVNLNNVVTGSAAFAGNLSLNHGTTEIWVPIIIDPASILGTLQLARPVKLNVDLLVTTPGLQVPVQATTNIL